MNPNPSLTSNSIEFFENSDKLYALQNGQTFCEDLPISILDVLSVDLESNPRAQLGLDKLGITDPIERLKKFAKCRYGSWNLQPDFDKNGKCTDVEVHECNKRTACPGCGLVCHSKYTAKFGSITTAEVETAKLIALGLTDNEIAEHLFIGVHAIHMRVKNMISKFDFRNRVQLAVWAKEVGIC